MPVVFSPYLRKAAEKASGVAPIPIPRPRPDDEAADVDGTAVADTETAVPRPTRRTAAVAAVVGLGSFLAGRWLVRRWRGDQSDAEPEPATQ